VVRAVGLGGVRVDVAMVRTPDGHGRLDLTKFHVALAEQLNAADDSDTALARSKGVVVAESPWGCGDVGTRHWHCTTAVSLPMAVTAI
jgi:hypothetical protein